MNVGILRTPLRVYSKLYATDEYGQTSASYTAGGTVFCSVNEATAEEKINHRALNQVVTHKIRMRWNDIVLHTSQLKTLQTTDGMSTKTWEVITVINFQERREFLDCVCMEIVA